MSRINMLCPLGLTGYGITSLNIYKKLRSSLDICLFPIGGATIEDPDDHSNIMNDIAKQNTYSKSDTCFKIWHQFDLAHRVGVGKYAALTFFEIDKLKPIEINMINNLDTVFVASSWAKNILLNNNITIPVIVSPLGIDPEIFDNKINADIKRDESKYIFMNIGKWELRKGHDILVEIFNDAFSPEDNVELWMINHNPFLNEQEHQVWHKLYQESKLADKIKILPRVPKHSDLAKLISVSDCGIFPARAEGWNNEVPEFFALNKPVILTNYSAHTEYATQDNSYLIEIDSLTKAIDNKFFDGFGNWANFGQKQYEQTIDYMRYVYRNNIRTNDAGLQTAKYLTWENTANIISNSLQSL